MSTDYEFWDKNGDDVHPSSEGLQFTMSLDSDKEKIKVDSDKEEKADEVVNSGILATTTHVIPLDQDYEFSEKNGDAVHPSSDGLQFQMSLGSDKEKIKDNSDKEVKDDGLVNSGIVATRPVIPLTADAAKILPMLQSLLVHNGSQRERLTELIQLCDPATVNVNPVVNAEGGQIAAAETDLSSVVQDLEQTVQRLEAEVENVKKQNAQLEDLIKRSTLNNNPENHD